jgi:hypothetical protein
MEAGGEQKKPEKRPHPAEYVSPGQTREDQTEKEKKPQESHGQETLNQEGDNHQQEKGQELGPGIQPVKE